MAVFLLTLDLANSLVQLAERTDHLVCKVLKLCNRTSTQHTQPKHCYRDDNTPGDVIGNARKA